MQAEDYADIAVQTLNDLGEGKWTDNVTEYQNTVALKTLIPDNKVTKQAGDQVRFQVMTDHNNSAEFVELGYTVAPNIPSLATFGRIPWRHLRWDYAWEYSLLAMNRTPRQIMNFMKVQRVGGMASAIVQFEKRLWRVPSASDTLTPYGLPYYVVKSSTAFTSGSGGNYGFTGSLPSDHTTVAEIDPTAYPRWKNYAEPYTAVTADDLVRKMRRAMYYTAFQPIVKEVPEYGGRNAYGCYTNYAVLGPLEELLKTQNDNLGMDLDPTGGKAVFRRTKVEAVRELDNDTTNPVYGINWGKMEVVALKDRWMAEDRFAKLPTQPTIGYANTHCTFNLICYDRRRHWVISNGTTELA